METRNCQNCKKEFIIEPDDFLFYEKIKVPPPTFCPECRMIRRMIWRNERVLKRAKCKLCGENILSMYPQNSLVNFYCQKCWWSDKWNPLDYGKDYDFSRPFFEQFKDLLHKVPYMALQIRNSKNVPYANFVADARNVYMSFSAVEDSENIIHSKNIDGSRNILDSFEISNSENCYWNINGDKNYSSIFLSDSRNCIDSSFLSDCVNCSNCFMCSGLRNKSFCIRNTQYKKEDYVTEIKKINYGNIRIIESLKKEFSALMKSSIRKFSNSVNCINFSGNDLRNSNNSFMAFNGYEYENVKYIFRSLFIKDSMDVVNAARAQLLYEFMAGGGNGGQNIKFIFAAIPGLSDTEYTHYSGSSSNLFACIGLRNKQYCILNKQYTKEEYEDLVPKIIKHMNDMPYIDSKGRVYKYGEFFPTELSPFAYNETIAQEYYPLTKEEAINQGYKWKDKEERNYEIDIYNKDIPDDINDTDESIIGKVIECAHKDCNHQCTEAFKIIPEEYQFYKRMNLPLPRLCPNCRHYERLAQRNPLKLWHRKCMCKNEGHRHDGGVNCTNEFETSYSPDRSEIVYCEKCYQQEVY